MTLMKQHFVHIFSTSQPEFSMFLHADHTEIQQWQQFHNASLHLTLTKIVPDILGL